MKTGLVSVSFRKCKPKEIIKLAKENSLEYIEWGGDCHVPMGNVRLAHKIKTMMGKAGLKCDTYGSYFGIFYRNNQHIPLSFRRVVKTAKALGASKIRIWAGFPGCMDGVDEREITKAVVRVRSMCDVAKKFGITLAFECHMMTFTEDYHNTIDFIKRVNRDNLKTYWQINPLCSHEYNMEAAKALLPYMTDVHVFYWQGTEKLPLWEGEGDWHDYMSVLKDENRIFMLEFMHDGEISSLKKTADTLRSFLK